MEIYLIDVREFLLPTVSFLSSEEANRYQRYVRQEDKDLFLMGRYLIRRYVGEGPLQKKENGKLFIEGKASFSLSHAYPYVALAISQAGEVGIDIEQKSRFEDETVIRLLSISKTNLPIGLHWCLNEALYKASGEGYFKPKEDNPILEDGAALYRQKKYAYRSFDGGDTYIVIASSAPIKDCCIIKVTSDQQSR